MATVRPPPDTAPIAVQAEQGLIAPRPWINFFRLLSTLWEALKGVSTITTPNVTPAAAATADGVPAAGTTTVVAADADATYSANEVTLINEIKTDHNTHITEFNALVTQFDLLVTQVNVMNTQLTATIALTNELKASHNAQQAAIQQ